MTNATDPLERELAEHLRRRAGAAPAADGWTKILGRVEQRHRRRQRRRVAASLLTVLALVGGVASFDARTTGGVRRVATAPPAAAASAGLPHLTLDLPRYELHNATAQYVAGETSQAGPLRLSVFLDPARGYDGPVLFVTVAPPGSTYGVGDRSGAARAVSVGSDTASLQRLTGLPVWSLGWYLPTGQAVHMVGLRMGEDDVLTAARGLLVGPDGDLGWRAATPSTNLVLQRSTETPVAARRTGEVTYVRGEASMTLRLQEGSDAVLDDLIRDRAAAALEIGRTMVAGVPAVLAVYEGADRSALIWPVRPGVVAELVAFGPARGDMLQAASSIREIDESAWQDLLDRFTTPPPSPLADTGNRVAAVVRSMCELRDEWLHASADKGRAASVELLRNLRRHAIESGAAQDTDVVAVLDRLLAAMGSGDAALVGAIPPGGGCS